MAKSSKPRKLSFSERYGYVTMSDAAILEKVPKEVANAISSALFRVIHQLNPTDWVLSDELNKAKTLAKQFTDEINEQFERLRFGYRLVNGVVVNIVSEEEIKSVQSAINNTSDKVSYGGELYNM